MDKILKEWLHYVVVALAVALAWVPIMDFFSGDVTKTFFVWFLVFVAVDQLVHMIILGEKISIW